MEKQITKVVFISINTVTVYLSYTIFWNPGHGVFATKPFQKGDFLLEYDGILISAEEADKRDQTYIYYISHNGKCFGYVISCVWSEWFFYFLLISCVWNEWFFYFLLFVEGDVKLIFS